MKVFYGPVPLDLVTTKDSQEAHCALSPHGRQPCVAVPLAGGYSCWGLNTGKNR